MPKTSKRCPKGSICIENYTCFILFFLFLIVLYYVYKNYFCKSCNIIEQNSSLRNTPLFSQLFTHYHNNMPPHLHKTYPTNHPPQIHSSHPLFNVSSDSAYNMLRPISDPSISYNNNPKDTLMNPYSPPVQYNEPHSYKQIGYLKNNQYGNKMFPIFAKPVHLRRDKWYYYTIYDNIKLPIYSNGRKCSSEHGCDSLMNGDIVNLENMGESFTVTIYDNHTLTYDPVI